MQVVKFKEYSLYYTGSKIQGIQVLEFKEYR